MLNRIFPLIILFVSSLLLLNNLFHNGIYESHDGPIHLARMVQGKQALKEGSFPLRWLGNWYYGFGYPTFVFIYSLPYYLGILISYLGISFESVFKILIFFSLFGSGITMFLFLRQHFPRLVSFVGAVYYISAPYRFADIYERGALGEALSFFLIPLLFYSLGNLKSRYKYLLLSITIFAFITTHALTFLIFLPAGIIYYLLISKRKLKNCLNICSAIIFGFALACFQWIPVIFEQKSINLKETYYNIYQGHFLTLNQLFRIPKAGINIGTGIQFGTAQMIVFIISLVIIIYRLIKFKKHNHLVNYFIVLTVISLFFVTGYSSFIWNNLSPLRIIIFPWRFLTLTTFIASYLAAYIFSLLGSKFLRYFLLPLFIILAIYPSRHYLKGSNWSIHTDNYYLHNEEIHLLDTYYLPKNLPVDLPTRKIENISLVTGQGKISFTDKKNGVIKSEVSLTTDSIMQFHTIYFPGWELSLNGKKWPIITDQKDYENLITAVLPSGNYKIELKFKETTLRSIGNLISLFSFLVLLIFLLGRLVIRLLRISVFS